MKNIFTKFIVILFRSNNIEEKDTIANHSTHKMIYRQLFISTFYEIPSNEENDLENSSNIKKKFSSKKNQRITHTFSLYKTSIIITMMVFNIVSYWAFIESFRLAIEVQMNVGILTCLIVLKPAIVSILFYLIFNQKLSRNDVIGVILLLGSIFMISIKLDSLLCFLSTNGWSQSNEPSQNLGSDTLTRFLSISMMALTIAIFTLGNIMVKKITKEVDFVFINNFIGFTVAIPFTIIFFYKAIVNSQYEIWELKIGFLLGWLNFITSILQHYEIKYVINLCTYIWKSRTIRSNNTDILSNSCYYRMHLLR